MLMMDPKECSSSQETGAIYQTKRVKFLGLDVLFILQNDAGPCPLLAICNVLLLQNKLNLPPDTTQIASFTLLRLVEERIRDTNRNIDGKDKDYVQDLQQNISDAIELLPCLATGLKADVCLRKFFDLLDIRLVHEQLHDSKNEMSSYIIIDKSHNNPVELRITPSNHLDLRSIDDIEFVPITESLEVPSHSHQHFPRGDKQEEFELELAMRLSKGVNLSTEDEFTIELASETVNRLYEEGFIKKRENALSSSQDSHGCLQKAFRVSYRNNHFNTMFEHGGQFYLLVTDQRCLNSSCLLWEKLNVVNSHTTYVIGTFVQGDDQVAIFTEEFPSSQQGDISRQVETWTTRADEELARVLQQVEFTVDDTSGLGPWTDRDLDFVIVLQQSEFTES